MTHRPLRGLLRQEFRLFAASRSNLAVLLALALLVGFAGWSGVERVRATRAAQAEAAERSEAAWAAALDNFVDVAEGGKQPSQFDDPRRADLVVLRHRHALALAPAPLAPLSAGLAREGHGIVEVGVQSRSGVDEASRENPANRLDGPFDVAFVVSWLLPVALVLLAYDALARDREQGVAPLLASQATPLRSILFARLGVRFIAVFAVVSGTAVAAVLAAAEGSVGRVALDLALWLFALAMFVGFWLALSALVNARARNSASAALAMLGTWLVVSLLLPALLSLLVARTAPPPNRLASVLGLRALQTDLTERAAEVTTAYYAENPARRPRRPAFDEYERYFVEAYYPRQVTLDRALAPTLRAERDRKAAQAQALRTLAPLSPPLAMKLLTDDLAGLAPERAGAFEAAVDAFRARWRALFDVKLAARVPMARGDFEHGLRFAHRDESLALRARRAAPLVGGLLLACVALAAAAHARLRRAGP